MGFALMRPSIAVIAACTVAVSTMASAAEQVEIAEGSATLRGVLFKPQGPGPFPGVVALHGCGGLVNRSGRIVRRFQDWGERLAAAGLSVLFPDSFTTRGLSAQCRVRESNVRTARERVADAQAA